jgi:uncharacterized membrane protein
MNIAHLKIDTTIRFVLGVIFIFISIISAIAPITQSVFDYPKGENIYSLLSPICHQYPTRSFWIMNRPFALCSRCFGGYLGLGLSFLIIHSNLKYIKRLILGLLLLTPGILDGFFQLITRYESINIIRFITGLCAGVGLFYMIYPVKTKIITQQKENLK